MPDSNELFFEAYDRDDVAYGETPSAPLAEYLEQVPATGNALDLGAGAGRDSMALARSGYKVLAVDMSDRGLKRIEERAVNANLASKVSTQVADVRDFKIEAKNYAAIVATTVLDHIPAKDALPVWEQMVAGLTNDGMLYAEVHTTEDPGSDQHPGCDSEAPVSETASAVVNYFSPGQLVRWATDPASGLRVLRYEERLEWDYTHGPEHLHGKAILLAVKSGFHPEWYGQPKAFPKRDA